MPRLFKRWREGAARLLWLGRDLADCLLFPPRREAGLVMAVRRRWPPLPDQAVGRLLVDVSVIHRHDAGTGIQRVVRSIRDALPGAVPADMAIDHLAFDHRAGRFVTVAGKQIAGQPGSLFLGLDFSTDAVFRARRQLADLRAAGVPLWFLVHDVLPISHPQWFTAASRIKYRRWMRTCAALADGFLCVSPATADALQGLLRDRYGLRELPRVVTITPGSKILPGDRRVGIDHLPRQPGLDPAKFARAAIVVGTLEPRKGHGQVLAAFERLWDRGEEIPLVLIGRPGWGTGPLQAAIRRHPRRGSLLFWCAEVEDDALHAAYRHCRLTLVPSLAEGYGLPLDEALLLGSPVLARDLPVFRRHGAGLVRFFPQDADTAALAAAISAAWHAAEAGRRADLPALRDWADTAHEVAAAIGAARAAAPLSGSGARAGAG